MLDVLFPAGTPAAPSLVFDGADSLIMAGPSSAGAGA